MRGDGVAVTSGIRGTSAAILEVIAVVVVVVAAAAAAVFAVATGTFAAGTAAGSVKRFERPKKNPRGRRDVKKDSTAGAPVTGALPLPVLTAFDGGDGKRDEMRSDMGSRCGETARARRASDVRDVCKGRSVNTGAGPSTFSMLSSSDSG